MKKLFSWVKKHFVTLLIILLAIIIAGTLFFETSDTPPELYATQDTILKVTEGQATLIHDDKKILESWESAPIVMNDKITTFPSSRATIFWADGSVTRLGENTTLTITTLSVSKDLSSIQIKFDTESGKTWSNVIRSLLPDSFFEQTYDKGNYVATVRGTVFEVNIDKNYVKSIHHGVGIKNLSTQDTTEVLQGMSVNAKNWDQMAQELLDTAWENFNESEDKKYLDEQLKKVGDTLAGYIKEQEWWPSWKKRISSLITQKQDVDAVLSDIVVDSNADKTKELTELVEKANTPEKRLAVNTRLLAYYQVTSLLPNSETTIALRETLRTLIIKTSAESQKAKFEDTFTQVTFNDYVDAVQWGFGEKAEELKKSFEQKAEEKGIKIPAWEELKKRSSNLTPEDALKRIEQDAKNLLNNIPSASELAPEVQKNLDEVAEKAGNFIENLWNTSMQDLIK